MARVLTEEQRALLRARSVDINILATFYLDEGTYRFCDDVWDLSDGVNTFIGASALVGATDIRSGSGLSAESVTLKIDGNRMAQFGIADPGKVLREILAYLHQQRRVDLAVGLRYPEQRNVTLTIPLYGGKINSARLIDSGVEYGDMTGDQQESDVLEIVLDSLASRYRRASNRTRSHADQQQLTGNTDDFFSFTADSVQSEKNLYWGKKAPAGTATTLTGVFNRVTEAAQKLN